MATMMRNIRNFTMELSNGSRAGCFRKRMTQKNSRKNSFVNNKFSATSGLRNVPENSSTKNGSFLFFTCFKSQRANSRSIFEPSCSNCFELQQKRTFFTSEIARKKLPRRKFEPINIKKKSHANYKPLNAWIGITIGDFAKQMNKEPDHIFECLLHTDFADIYDSPKQKLTNHLLLRQICTMSGYKLMVVAAPSKTAENLISSMNELERDAHPQPPAKPEDCQPRPPVVTIMGHVDHGKTTLLDSLRNSQIVAGEFGGITQHIGAFSVKLPLSKETITFLDTPGHAAFHSMRQRGADATDIVVLVVAADDGVMEQTVESIRFAKQANVPIVVAVNKCDKYQSDPDRVRKELLNYDVVTEDYQGDCQSVCISALKGTNLKELQEAILTQAEVMNLTADYKGLVEGAVVECRTAHGIGKLCTVLVQRGTLEKGSFLVGGTSWCKVRTIQDERGNPLKSVPPSFPAEVSGWKEEMPSPGDLILEVESELKAKSVVAYRREQAMEKKAEDDQEVIAIKREEARKEHQEKMQKKLAAGYRRGRFRDPNYIKPKEAQFDYDTSLPSLGVLVKGDVDGSVEAIVEVFDSFHSELCRLDLVDFGIGPPTENDIIMAADFKSIIYCFNVSVPPAMRDLAQTKGVKFRNFNVIYHLVDDLKKELTDRLPLIPKERMLGEGVVLKEFVLNDKKKKRITVAGCRVKRGTLNRKKRFKFRRGDEVYFDGKCLSMKKEQQIVHSATTMEEVGLIMEDKGVRFEPDDVVECYEIFEEPQKLDWNPPGF